ncbi:pre-mRNA-splicing factor CWC22 [Clonorchis sinensis]|uniref:Pre-mRNA-splicing factor CWC22 n=1 Tax=Clonorchis sinensis TaxID=79923 RepID=H2KNG1_CLOSI|nr:pre-mRNA-splicing factor CWC22 [Clonorchis sinensis]
MRQTLEGLQNPGVQIAYDENLVDLEYADDVVLIFEEEKAQVFLDELTKVIPSFAAEVVNIYGKTGGAYIPPARLRQMQAQITDKSSEAYQRIAWEALKKSIHGFINKVNVSNISDVVRQLLSENVVRGRGLLVRSLLTAQSASPTFTHVFAALVAVVNSKFPQVGELVLKRLINEFRKAFRRNQKDRCLSTARFLAHLVNQKVVHELIVLELLTLLLEQTTDDSVEVAVAVLKECGAMLTRLVPKGVHGVFEHLRRILNEGNCDKRISYMLEVMFQIRRDGWKDHPIVLPDLELIEEDDQITHTTSLLDQVDPEDSLNVFRFDPNYVENEEKYAKIKASFFESDAESEAGSGDEEADDSESSGDEDAEDDERGAQGATAATGEGQQTIIDQTETNLVHLRRTIYLMLQSSLSADEAGHRLLQLKIKPGEEYEVASMVLDCCAQTRSYESRYGRLAQRLCRVMLTFGNPPPTSGGGPKPIPEEVGPGSRYKSSSNTRATTKSAETTETTPAVEDTGPPRSYVAEFERIFAEQYAIIHRLETAKLRNVALFFAHLLHTDSISWGVLECVRLNERDTTSSGRIFLKHLFLELCSFMGLAKLQNRLRDETLQPFFAGLLPRDNPKDTRFAINFLTTIGLGGLTLDLREHLQASREAALAKREAQAANSDVESLSEEVEDQDESSTSSSSDSSSSDSDLDRKKKVKNHHVARKPKGKSPTENKAVEKKKHTTQLAPKESTKSGSKLKERPLDTPFFNDIRNSPPHSRAKDRELIAVEKKPNNPNPIQPRERSLSKSPEMSVRSTITVPKQRQRSPFDLTPIEKEVPARYHDDRRHRRDSPIGYSPPRANKSTSRRQRSSEDRSPHRVDTHSTRKSYKDSTDYHSRRRRSPNEPFHSNSPRDHTSRSHRSPDRSNKRDKEKKERHNSRSPRARSPFSHHSSKDRLRPIPS